MYYGGGTSYDNDEYIVYCYDPSQDQWSALPPLPVRYFGLGQVNGRLVAAGGEKSGGLKSNVIYMYDEQLQKWKQSQIIPPMPTARESLDVLTLQSALIVAGGDTPSSAYYNYVDLVEIFKLDTSQWYQTDPLPMACYDMSLVAIGNTCFALGGYNYPLFLNQALYASVDDLLGNVVPANQTMIHSDRSDSQSAWKKLPNTPTYRPAAAVLAGNLLAIGGKETSKGGADMNKVYMYSPSANSWIYISDLPAPRTGIAVAVLSSTEILVIGGWYEGHVNTVYKGILHFN